MSAEYIPTFGEIIEDAHATAVDHGWWEGQMDNEGKLIQELVDAIVPEKLALIHSEVSEALEDFRTGEDITTLSFESNGKPVGFPSELADILIRVFDLARAKGIDLESAVKAKMEYNRTRPYRHGGKRA